MEQSAELEDIPQPDLTDVVIDCTTMGYVDSVGVTTLSQVLNSCVSVRKLY